MSFKKNLRKVIIIRPINYLLRYLIKILNSFIANPWFKRFPINGTVAIRLAGGEKLSLVSVADDPIVPAIYYGGLYGYEGMTSRIWVDLSKQSQNILDIGANTGIFTVLAGLHHNAGNIFAFEPVPRIFNRLQQNCQLNQLNQVKTYQVILSDEEGEATLFIPKGIMPTSASTVKGHRKAVEEIRVAATTVDKVLADAGVQSIDLIKIDTETTEHIVLKGAISYLTNSKPIIICEVLYNRVEAPLNELLGPLGYEYFWIRDDGLHPMPSIVGDPNYTDLNFCFVPKEKRDQIDAFIV